MSKSTSKEGSTHWWEFYVVRYAMGTVVGAVIFYLVCQEIPQLKPLLLSAGGGGKAPDAALLPLFAAYGLVYCYIASAPILVFHAGRFLLPVGATLGGTPKLKWSAAIVSVPAVATAVAAWLASSAQSALVLAVVFVAVLLIWLQVIALWHSVKRGDVLYSFYVRLDQRRQKSTAEIKDSYRHLREHGNSFFIVALEIVLAAVLVVAGKLAADWALGAWVIHVVVLLVWILPAAAVWAIGTLLERRFADDNPSKLQSPTTP